MLCAREAVPEVRRSAQIGQQLAWVAAHAAVGFDRQAKLEDALPGRALIDDEFYLPASAACQSPQRVANLRADDARHLPGGAHDGVELAPGEDRLELQPVSRPGG